jgi:hypothetical protein
MLLRDKTTGAEEGCSGRSKVSGTLGRVGSNLRQSLVTSHAIAVVVFDLVLHVLFCSV